MSTPHHIVNRLHVTGGFLGGVDLEFVDGLNCLIGGRGTGKTTALELLRFGLGLMPDPKVHSQRHKYIDGLVKVNLGTGAITVTRVSSKSPKRPSGRTLCARSVT